MDNIDIELRKVLDVAIQSTSHGLIECNGMTLKELFQSKLNGSAHRAAETPGS